VIEHDPRVEPEGMLFRKPDSTPDQVRGRLFGIMLRREHSGNEEGPASPPGLEIDSLER
jgi:hypothetical protein